MAKKSSFFNDFKVFITRGNVIDMAVGVIVGGAFTAIVNSLSNNILRPLINWLLAIILGKDSLSDVYTFLQIAYKEDETGAQVIDLAESIYIDWGAFVNAIINFFIIAGVLFTIVRIINNIREFNEDIKEGASKAILNRHEIAELKANGVNIMDRKAVDAYFENKARIAKEAEEKARAEALSKEAAREAQMTTEDLLKEIRDLLKNK
jgi:large conductance mechanosensitive channel